MLLKLHRARAEAFQQLQPEEQGHLARDVVYAPDTILQELANWQPVDFRQFQPRHDVANWTGYFAWRQHLVFHMLQWLQLFQWPREPGGPLTKETGVSWVELGLSLSHFLKGMLPILRKNSESVTQIIWVQDADDAMHYQISFLDISTTMEKMWSQLHLWFDEISPGTQRGRNSSLQVQGFTQHSLGIAVRPRYPFQGEITAVVQSLRGKGQLNHAVVPTWCARRTQTLEIANWDERCAVHKDRRRKHARASREGVSLQ